MIAKHGFPGFPIFLMEWPQDAPKGAVFFLFCHKNQFLDENIYVTLDSEIKDEKLLTDILLKMPNLNLLAKANLFSSE